MLQGVSQLLGSADRPIRCSRCEFDNAAGKKFCIRCGTALSAGCPKCGSENPPEAGFCGECGVTLTERTVIMRSAERPAARVNSLRG